MDRIHEIDSELTEKITEFRRRQATDRVFRDLGINALLDERNELTESIKQFEKIFGGGI